MSKIIALCGIPGAGKTTFRNREYPTTPFLDVADIYDQFPGISPKPCFAELINRLLPYLDRGEDVIVEAMFQGDNWQRLWLKTVAEANFATVEFIEFKADPEVCLERIQKDFNLALKGCKTDAEKIRVNRRFNARLDIVRSQIETR